MGAQVIPGNALTATPMEAPFQYKMRDDGAPLIDYETGGVALNDGSQGMLVRVWKATLVGDDIMVGADGVTPVSVYSTPGITRLALAFDQNMQTFIAWEDASGAHCRFYNDGAFSIIDLPAGSSNVCATGDENRIVLRNTRDIILAYQRGSSLYFRQQRERFAVEHSLSNAVIGKLSAMGMNKQLRMQFRSIAA
jgi:hypothetical protein